MNLSYVVSTSATRFAAVGQGRGPAEAMRFLAGVGFEGVELAIRDPSQVDVGRLAAVASGLGVAVPAIGTGQAYLEEGLSLAAPEAAIRERTVGRLLAHVDTARRMHALLIVGLIHGPIPPEADREAAAARLLDGLGRVARAAAEAGVRIVIEPINRYESNWLNTVEEVLELIERLGADNVGVLPDTFHMNIEEASIPAALRRAGPRVWHVHVADSNRRAPGDGHLEWAEVVAVLREIGYTGFLSAEILPHPTLEEAARRTIEVLRAHVPRSARAAGPGGHVAP